MSFPSRRGELQLIQFFPKLIGDDDGAVDAVDYVVAVLQTGTDSLSVQFTPQNDDSTNPQTFVYHVDVDLTKLYNTLELRLKTNYPNSGNTVELALGDTTIWSDTTGPASKRFTKISAFQVGGSSHCIGKFGGLAEDFYGAFKNVMYGDEMATIEQIIKSGVYTVWSTLIFTEGIAF